MIMGNKKKYPKIGYFSYRFEFIMKTEEFLDVKSFLEKMIEKESSNSNFLDAYLKLLELKSNYDLELEKKNIEKEIKFAKFNLGWHKSYHLNNADVTKNYQDNFARNLQYYASLQYKIPYVFEHRDNY